MTGIGRHLRRAAGPPADPTDATDGQLLDRFLTGRDVARLPARYRDVVALCELGGRTRKEAAALLGIPVTAAARAEEREVLVARGKYVHRPRPGKLNGQV